MLAMIILAVLVLSSLAFLFGAMLGRAAGWQEGYEAAGNQPPAENIPADTTPFVRDAGLSRIYYDRHP